MLFVSQQEIEEIGRDSGSRRRILDDAAVDEQAPLVAGALEDAVEEAAKALHSQRAELDDVVQRLAGLSEVPEQLKAAQKEQQEYKTQSDELIELQKQASSLSDELGDMGAQAEALATGSARASSWRADLVQYAATNPTFSRLPQYGPS
jgi:DNA repair exonuclease SbcCD ATPase subunit